MVVFEVLGPMPDGADGVLAAATATAWRQDGRIHIGLRSSVAPFVRDAGLAGLRLRSVATAPPDRAVAAIEAHGRDLRPIQCAADTIDRLDLRPIRLAEATDRLLRRAFPFAPLPARRRTRCRDLLHGRDAAYAVTRVVWCPRAALRDAAYRRSLRPVVFDHGAGAPVLVRTVADGDLAAWLRG